MALAVVALLAAASTPPWHGGAGVPPRRHAVSSAPPPPPTPKPSLLRARLCAGAERSGRVVLPLLRLAAFKPPLGPYVLLVAYRRFRRKSVLEDAAAVFPRAESRSLDLDESDKEYESAGALHTAHAEALRRQIDEELETRPADEYLCALAQALELQCKDRSARAEFVAALARVIARLPALRPDAARWSAPRTAAAVQQVRRRASPCHRAILYRPLLRCVQAELLLAVRLADALLRTCRELLLCVAREARHAEHLCQSREREKLAKATAVCQQLLQLLGKLQELLLLRPPSPDAPLLGAEAWSALAGRWCHAARPLVVEILHTTEAVDAEGQFGEDPSAASERAAMRESLREWESSGELEARMQARRRWERRQVLKRAAGADGQLLPPARWAKGSVASSVVSLGVAPLLALAVHYASAPYWPAIATAGERGFSLGKAILVRRFWTPLKAIALDLLNRRDRLVDSFALVDAEQSLLNMLDEFLADARAPRYDRQMSKTARRRAALEAVSREYEAELRRGAVQNLIRGKMVRMALIQVQAIKVEMLKAMGAIDDLVDANRLNVQLLAAVPSVLLLTAGSRLFFAALFSFRSHEIRSIHAAHERMSEILNAMERRLLVASTSAHVAPEEEQSAAAAAAAQMATFTLTGGFPTLHVCPRPLRCSRRARCEPVDAVARPPAQSFATDASAIKSNKWWRMSAAEPSLGISPAASSPPVLQGAELGEFVLLLHSYLQLLDSGSPPFSRRSTNAIHRELQELLQISRLGTPKQVALLWTTMSRNDNLKKFL
ncbi:hypothetical protein AB1Y20_006446 [Prymnesium parvum]|uniref:Nuclear control of ATPase protein 2 n=1 Tax=Prymnesium parvum TaxID=97485 RepID=A0AB34IY07_PRYPA